MGNNLLRIIIVIIFLLSIIGVVKLTKPILKLFCKITIVTSIFLFLATFKNVIFYLWFSEADIFPSGYVYTHIFKGIVITFCCILFLLVRYKKRIQH